MWVVGLGLIQLVEGLKCKKLRFPVAGILPQDCYIKITHQFLACLFALRIC